jgi:hypothetical protein
MLKGVAVIIMVCIVNWSLAQNMAVTRLRNETARNVTRVADTGYFNWKQGGMYNFNLSQSSLSNWAAGGDNFNMSLSSYFNYYAYFQKPRQSWDNNFDANLGFVQSTSIGGRKNDDRIDLVSKYGYRIDTTGMWYLSALFNVRSQIFDGHSFSGNNSTLTSSFFSPAYVILSAGLDYKPNTIFSVFFSPLTSRTTLLLNTRLSNLGSYGVPKGDKIYKETGLFVTVNYNNVIAPNINYRGRVDLFSNYYEKPENINFYMTNFFTFKINKNFSANYSLDLMYDDKIKSFGPNKNSPGLQLKSIVGIGYFKNLQVKKIILKPKP